MIPYIFQTDSVVKAMKVVFDLRAGRIAIEGDGPELLRILQVARDIAPQVSQIQITADSDPAESNSAHIEPGLGDLNTRVQIPQTMRRFARSLALGNTSEKIAALAYYANKIEGKPSFSPKDLDGWFTMCGFQKPSQMPVALFDSKRKYGLTENVSRGNWRISNQGENLILRKIEERNDGS